MTTGALSLRRCLPPIRRLPPLSPTASICHAAPARHGDVAGRTDGQRRRGGWTCGSCPPACCKQIPRSLAPAAQRKSPSQAWWRIQLASARGFHKSVRVEDSCSEMLRMRMVTKLDPSKAVLLESPPPSAALRPQSFIPGGTTRECAARPRAEDWQSRAGCGAGGAECLFSTRLPPRLPRRRRRRTRFRPEQKRKKRETQAIKQQQHRDEQNAQN